MTRFEQARVSDCLRWAKGPFLKKFHLADFASYRKPAVFFGCYGPTDLFALRRHYGPKLLIWGGTDAMNSRIVRGTLRCRDCYHVAISDYISKDLERFAIPHVRLPVTPVDHDVYDLGPCVKGDAIYVYTSPGRPEFYGQPIIETLQREFPEIEFIVCHQKSYSRERLCGIYKKCFMGLRLVEHDGLPNTVVELGLMGRYTVHNGGLPSSLPYANIDDIRKHIVQQRETIGTIDRDVARRTSEYIALPPDWLDVEYYANRCEPAKTTRSHLWFASPFEDLSDFLWLHPVPRLFLGSIFGRVRSCCRKAFVAATYVVRKLQTRR